MQQTAATDRFPSTQFTWIGRRLDEGDGGLSEVRRHVMNTYFVPLTVYVRGSVFRQLGDPEELVQGFFASRLNRPEYFARWRTSGRPLRRWLITGLRHFLLETARDEVKRRGLARGVVEQLEDDGRDAAPPREFDDELTRSLVAEALRLTHASLACDGLTAHWEAFTRHHVDGRSYDELAREHGENAERLAVMARTARRRFRETVRSLLAWPGASAQAIDDEINELLRR